jgi:uncharacterized protein (DUF1684 family)
MSELEEFRAAKDAFFRHDPRSPLTPEQRSTFEGLQYFDPNPDLVIRAPFETEGIDPNERIVMQTTTGGQRAYRLAGKVRFEVDGEPAELTLFASPDMHELFVPFRDGTSGHETYGAGRYLEVDPPGADGEVVVDLNDAYNPYCAYNPEWSCPIPPAENRLPVPIRAGEKDFRGVG